MQLHPLMPVAILAVALITAGIALMVFDGARKAKLLEIREGWARGLRNDLALVLARLQNIELIAATDQKKYSQTFDEMLIRFYRAQLRLRGGEGHVEAFKPLAAKLTQELENIREMFNAAGSVDENLLLTREAAKSIHDVTETKLRPAALIAMTVLWEDISHAGSSYIGLHFWLGSFLLVAGLVGAFSVGGRALGFL